MKTMKWKHRNIEIMKTFQPWWAFSVQPLALLAIVRWSQRRWSYSLVFTLGKWKNLICWMFCNGSTTSLLFLANLSDPVVGCGRDTEVRASGLQKVALPNRLAMEGVLPNRRGKRHKLPPSWGPDVCSIYCAPGRPTFFGPLLCLCLATIHFLLFWSVAVMSLSSDNILLHIYLSFWINPENKFLSWTISRSNHNITT